MLWEYQNCFYVVDGISHTEGAILILYDVSDRVRAERALQEQEEKYRLLTEHAPTGIVMVQEGRCSITL